MVRRNAARLGFLAGIALGVASIYVSLVAPFALGIWLAAPADYWFLGPVLLMVGLVGLGRGWPGARRLEVFGAVWTGWAAGYIGFDIAFCLSCRA